MHSHVFPCVPTTSPSPPQNSPGPGYPFLGNDFYRECGDVFASHAIDNPEVASEVELLRSYGPNVPQDRMGWLFWVCQDEHIQVGDESVLWGWLFFTTFFFSPIIAYHCYHVRSLHIIKLPTPDQVMFFKGHFFLLLSLFLWLRAYIHLAWS